MSKLKMLCTIVLPIFFLPLNSHAAVINVRSFGAKGNGVADDRKAIQAAINAAPADSMNTIYFPAGTYRIGSYTTTYNYLENYCLLLHDNLTIKGDGEKTVIRLASHMFDKPDTPANAHVFYGLKINNIHFTDLLIDMNGCDNLAPKHYIKNQAGIFVYLGSNISLKKITIKNDAGRNMVVIKGNGNFAIIDNCKFLNGGNYVGTSTPNKYQDDFSFVYSEWDSTTISNNTITQENIEFALSNYTGGIEIHGSYSTASNNVITGCNPACYVSSSWHPMEKTTVENNHMINCLKGISFFIIHPMNNIAIVNNNIQLTYTRLLKTPLLSGIEMPNGNIDEYKPTLANAAPVSNLTITGNNITAILPDTTKDKTIGMILHSLQNSKITGNTITGMNYAGILINGSKWGINQLTVTDNKFVDFKQNNDEHGVAGYVVITDTYTPKNKNAPGLKDISFTNNKFVRNKPPATKGVKGKFLGAFIALPSAMLSEIKFTGNNFSDANEKVLSVKTD